MPNISSQSIVERGATLAADVRVGPFCYIGPEVRLGAGCIIENNVTIIGQTVLGEKTHVFPMTVVGASSDGPSSGKCQIGKANTIREQVTIYGGQKAATRIGDDNLLMIASQVGPGAAVGDHGIFANCTVIGAGAKVEDYVRSSAFAAVSPPGTTVGAYTFIAGYVTVDRDAPPYAILQGCPFRIRGANTENLRRCGFSDQDVRLLKEAFRELFDGHSAQASEQALPQRYLSPSAKPLLRRLAETIQQGKGRKRRR